MLVTSLRVVIATFVYLLCDDDVASQSSEAQELREHRSRRTDGRDWIPPRPSRHVQISKQIVDLDILS